MVRLLLSAGLQLVANAIGLVVAASVLEDMRLSVGGFLTALVVFTVAVLVLQPFVAKVALGKATALMGSSALVASLLGLIIAAWLSDGLRISGFVTWVLATVIVWATALLATLLLPLVIFRKAFQQARAS